MTKSRDEFKGAKRVSFNHAKRNDNITDQEMDLERLDRYLLDHSLKPLSPEIKQTKKSYEPL